MNSIRDTAYSIRHTPKVFVGLSGGVDSAVSAALLKEQGYDVVGAFIKIWQPEFIECTWESDRLDAMRVCAVLGIPFSEIDLSTEYKREVIRDMVEGYTRGITPNPDVLCNKIIKFGSFRKWAHAEGADMIATGHYARIEKIGHRMSILRGKDAEKDQSYFLWQLTEYDLEHALFPVGTYTKAKVRALARKFELPVATKKDSQGLCFVGSVTIPEFLGFYSKASPGKIFDERGLEVGTHAGAIFYTPGQRHGITLRDSGGSAHFVTRVDVQRNVVHVSSNRADAARKKIRLHNVNWLSAPQSHVDAQVRYREKTVPATISSGGDIVFEEPRIIAPGQSVVFYDGSRVLGGGIAAP